MSERKMPSVEDFPSNAIGSENKETRPAIKGKVRRKKSFLKGMRDEFVSEDADNMGSYLLNDILFPALRDLINDICHGAIDAAFGGGGNYRRGSSRSHRSSYISYDRIYDNRRGRRRRERDIDDYDDDDDRIARRRLPDCSEFIFDPDRFKRPSDARREADNLLDDMADRIEEYGEVTLAWFLDQVGADVVGAWNAENWGWTNLAGVKVRGSNRNGWYIDLPRPKEL